MIHIYHFVLFLLYCYLSNLIYFKKWWYTATPHQCRFKKTTQAKINGYKRYLIKNVAAMMLKHMNKAKIINHSRCHCIVSNSLPLSLWLSANQSLLAQVSSFSVVRLWTRP